MQNSPLASMGHNSPESTNRGHIPVKVFVRVRPLKNELEYYTDSVSITNSRNQRVSYGVDSCFGAGCSTADIYAEIKPLLKEPGTLNLSVLAYGQTGSGKTHTMMGTEDSPGLVSLALESLLKISPVDLSFIEIYKERVYDLLDGQEKTLLEGKAGAEVQGLIKKTVTSMEEYKAVAKEALGIRRTGETDLNKLSSRSHLIIKAEAGDVRASLVDLAGSESNRKTGNSGQRMEESASINRSLFVFNSVVNALARGDKRIPYRDSKLTRLLRDSIGGTGRCFLVATIVDSLTDSNETINTLSFASKSRQILNRPEAIIERKILGPRKREVGVEMTPITKRKSSEYFMKQAKACEGVGNMRGALEAYRMLEKIGGSEEAGRCINVIKEKLRKKKDLLPEKRIVDILNSGDFLELKKLHGVGDKRAKIIADYVADGKRFNSIEDLLVVFKSSVIKNIQKYVDK